MRRSQPSWQQTPCPAWCNVGHLETDHAEDRTHQHLAETVPVISRHISATEGCIVFLMSAEEFEVGVSLRDGETTVWVYLGTGPGNELQLDLQSWERVSERMRQILS